ncbi:MAG TPA: AraC family ligand binding domain-containing protein [Gemmatimonadaceae bacterium]|jgi:Uncharacterized conserved protein, contains double-stranded beta-helix domain
MNTYDIGALAAGAVAARPTNPATALVHDSPDARIVVFRLEAGQHVSPHSTTSTVILTVVSGSGFVSGPDGERAVRAGELAAYAPNELHGMRAPDEQCVFLAVITPRPGSVR